MSIIVEIAESLARLLDAKAASEIVRAELKHNVSLLLDVSGDTAGAIEACGALAALFGTDVLFNQEIRAAMFARCPMATLEELAGALTTMGAELPARESALRQYFATRKLEPGSTTAFEYCRVLGLPRACVGQHDAMESRPPEEAIAPHRPLNPLHPYQRSLAQKIEGLLDGRSGRRAMVALPTGAGKTRTLVDTLLGWRPLREGTRSILWVAQHEELCEQAIACFRDVWQSPELAVDRDLRVQRVWDSKSPGIDWTADIIVGIPESLKTRLSNMPPDGRLGAVVIDEAHLSRPAMYNEIFAAGSTCAIIGLSATPENPNDPFGNLRKVFMGNLFVSDELGHEPVQRLQDMGVLSRTEFERMTTCDVSAREHVEDRERSDFSGAFLVKVGRNAERQRVLLERLLEVPEGVSTLCFAPSVPAARALSAAMALRGRSAAYVDFGVTGYQRRQTLQAFRGGGVQFLFNFQVLATGFDAPRIACLVLGRPTRNRVLYEQMIGRGLRGPRNGGTESCTILYFDDQFSEKSLNPRSYAAFGSWSQ